MLPSLLLCECLLFSRVMQITIDSTKIDRGPLLDNRIHMSLYYVCFVVVFSFFFLNIFVALIIVTFQERGERELTGCELTKNQVFQVLFVVVIFVLFATVMIALNGKAPSS